MNALAATEFQLALRLLQALLQTLLRLRATAPQPLLECRQRRRCEEEVAGVEVRALDLFDALSTPSLSVSRSEVQSISDIRKRQPSPFGSAPEPSPPHSSDGGEGRGLERGGEPRTSISISSTQTRPRSDTSRTARTLVP